MGGSGVAFVIIMMAIVGTYWVWPKLGEARMRFIDATAHETERERGDADEALLVAVAGSTLLAALLISIIALAFA